MLESELWSAVGAGIAGPGITTAQVLGAAGAIAPAFEIAYTATIMADMPHRIAQGAGQRAFVSDQSVPA